jgi:hypothetical protein
MKKKELVFNNIGKNVNQFSDFDEMFKYSGLDYKVGTTQTYFQIHGTKDYKPLEDKQCIYNIDTNEPLGVVGRGYNIIQNRDAFKIIKNV